MATDTTIPQLRAMYKGVQHPGSRVATVFGVFLFAVVLLDTWTDALNGSSVDGLLLSSLGITNYHAVFSVAVLVQLSLLGLGFFLLLQSKWPMITAFHMKSILVAGWTTAKQQQARNQSVIEGQSRPFLMVCGLLITCFVGSAMLVFHLANLLFQLFPAILISIVLAGVLAWDLATVLFVARRDIYVTLGLVLSLFVSLIGWEEGPTTLLQLPHNVPSYIFEMQFWEALMFGSIIVGLLPLLVEREQEENIFRLELSRGTLPDSVTTVATFGEESLRPISVMFDLHSLRAVALYGTKGIRELVLLNVNDPQLCLPLHGHSLKLWNMSSLEFMAGSGSAVADSTGCFSVVAELRMMSTTASFRANEGLTLDPTVVDVASDLIFDNAHLYKFLHQVGVKSFDESVKSYSREIRQIRGSLEAMRPKLHLDATMPVPRNLVENLNPGSHAEVRQAQMHFVGTAHMEEVIRYRARFDLAIEGAQSAMLAAESAWIHAVHIVFIERSVVLTRKFPSQNTKSKSCSMRLGLNLRFPTSLLSVPPWNATA